MPPGFDIHDDPCAYLRAQRKMRQALIGFGIGTVLVALAAPLTAVVLDGADWVPVVAGLLLTLHAGWTIHRLARLRQRVWRVAISPRHVVALDAGRRQTSVAWSAVERVEVDDEGLTLVSRGLEGVAHRLHVRPHFAAYVALGHQLVRMAERRRCAIWVDGAPWQRLDVSALVAPLRRTLHGEA